MPDKKKVLIVQNIHHKGIELLKNRSDFEYEILDSEEMVDKIDPELFKQKIKDCDAMSIRTEKLPGEIIGSAKKLKIISRHGVGYDNVDLVSTKNNNITLAQNDSIRECETTHSSPLTEIFFDTLDEIDCLRDPFSTLK